ncbi:MAG: hypothetical protein MUP81_03105 [Dehalococcoidia bacterium]|nr:hypothetical protein [Dehalococcoidia bacterium]
MPTLNEVCEFTVPAVSFILHTQVNGDTLVLEKLELSKEEAASLAWLINHPEAMLKVKIKIAD